MKNNLVIKASAGTGKTFAIATQFIRLLVLGGGKIRPETILGLTFSRAAAQEIYEKILNRLREAAASDGGARKEKAILLADLDDDEKARAEALDFSPATFTGILRSVIDAQGHGTIATLDSFIQRIVQKFPLELGFQKALSVLDDYGEHSAVESAVAGVLSSTEDDDDIRRNFSVSQNEDAVRSGISKVTALTDSIGSWLQFLRDHPEAKAWTAESMTKALGIDRNPVMPDLSAIPVSGKRNDPKDAIVARATSAASKTFDAGKMFDGKSGELMRHLLNHPDATSYSYETDSGNVKTIACGPEEAGAIRAAARYMVAIALNRKLDVAAAKLRLCEAVESQYDAAARRNGLLTFSDFTDCLARNEDESGKGSHRLAPKDWLLNLQFRLDSQFSHWALDEFQDTSTAQWDCLKALVEAAVSDGADGSGERSVLAVGDLKQSIYRWRGGCNEPFEELEKKVVENQGAIETLALSYRYGRNTASFIDDVFGPENVKAMAGDSCSNAVRKWEDECWPKGGHKSNGDGDSVEIVSVPRTDGDEGNGGGDDDDDGDFKPSAAMRVLAPKLCRCVRNMWARHEADKAEAEASGKTFKSDEIGILVRNNKDGLYLAERLRKMETESGKPIPVIWEGTNGVLDSPVVRAVLELLQLAEHPEDKFAWKVVDKVFPLREKVFPTIERVDEVSTAVSRSLSKHGLARTLETFVAALKAGPCAPDARTSLRLDQLVREGARFEERPDGGGIAGFREYLATVSDREIASSPDVVRILTIHRSKGLTLDHVIVPITSSDDLLKAKSNSRIAGEGWVVDSLAEDWANANQRAKAALEEAANGHLLDELCTWYVALTRAVKSTRVFVVDDDRPGTQFRDLLLRPFHDSEPRGMDYGTVLYSSGNAPSFVTFLKEETDHGETEAVAKPVKWEHGGKREDIRHVTPSTALVAHGGRDPVFVASFFQSPAGREDASRRGVEEHAAFAEIAWIDPANPKDDRERTIQKWGGAWCEAFRETSGATVWREKSYELFDAGRGVWETGQFDRVVFRCENGKRTAEIYDFKTNANRENSVAEFEEKMRNAYVGQMADYRSAISRLCGIQPEYISSTLLLTATGTSVEA